MCLAWRKLHETKENYDPVQILPQIHRFQKHFTFEVSQYKKEEDTDDFLSLLAELNLHIRQLHLLALARVGMQVGVDKKDDLKKLLDPESGLLDSNHEERIAEMIGLYTDLDLLDAGVLQSIGDFEGSIQEYSCEERYQGFVKDALGLIRDMLQVQHRTIVNSALNDRTIILDEKEADKDVEDGNEDLDKALRSPFATHKDVNGGGKQVNGHVQAGDDDGEEEEEEPMDEDYNDDEEEGATPLDVQPLDIDEEDIEVREQINRNNPLITVRDAVNLALQNPEYKIPTIVPKSFRRNAERAMKYYEIQLEKRSKRNVHFQKGA